MIEIRKEDLIKRLENLDRELLGVWIDERIDLNDDSRWELFVDMLESRVELLRTIKDAGYKLSSEICVPEWLVKLTNNRREIRLRELKKIQESIRHAKKVRRYELNSDGG